MTGLLADRIAARLSAHGLVASDAAVAGLAAYLQQLSRWNERVNLTAIPLGPSPSDQAIDKLLVEPVLATTLLDATPRTWFDLGTGGGSPAIPLRCLWRAGTLRMVESREKKGAFLREVVRQLGLAGTSVSTCRFDDLGEARSVDLVTLRAVRVDSELVALLDRLLSMRGQVLAFGSAILDDAFVCQAQATLPDGSSLNLYGRL